MLATLICWIAAGAVRVGYAAESPRSPQFVLFAFDNAGDVGIWNQTRQFSAQLRERGITLHFTYFVNAISFIPNSERKNYQGPRHRAGYSDIGFGGSLADVQSRIDQVRLAHQEGHEIGSHAVGHLDGTHWTTEEWNREFDLFEQFTKVLSLPLGWLVGFRAPYLGAGASLDPALSRHRFRYDTSGIDRASYWPQKSKSQIWRFPLARLKIAETGLDTLSMDYNFYYAQSKAHPASERQSKVFSNQMLKTYRQYFQGNYRGNRAPLHIGHHFALWNHGAYWEALKSFATEVCGLPEVRCVTYRELADFLDRR